MKNFVCFFLFILLLKYSFSQNFQYIALQKSGISLSVRPFIGSGNSVYDIELLKTIAESQDSILPKYIEGKFYYFNKNTNEKAIEKPFDLAYPFVGESALIMDNEKYGVINRNGEYIIKPYAFHLDYQKNKKFRMLNLFFNNADTIIKCPKFSVAHALNLKSGEVLLCRDYLLSDNDEPYYHYYPINYLRIFKGKRNKYGITQNTDYRPRNFYFTWKNGVHEINDSALMQPIIWDNYDSILHISNWNTSLNNPNLYIIAKHREKYGILNGKQEDIIPFIYDAFFSKSYSYISDQVFDYSTIFAFRANREWNIYDFNLKSFIATTEYTPILLYEDENRLALIKIGKQFNILFRDGSTYLDNYDWISNNGLIGTKDGELWIFEKNTKARFQIY